MKHAWILNLVLMAALVTTLSLNASHMVASAAHRLEVGSADASEAPVIASSSDLPYCTATFKAVLRRVLTSCGLIGGGRRGCQPSEVRNVAQINDQDFNALFHPLSKRGGVVLFDVGSEDLDQDAKRLIEDLWSDRRGAGYFFVVARASPDGPTEKNRILSHKRANSVLFFLQDRFQDPDIEKKVGLLWLGEEYAQLGTDFCRWRTSRSGSDCTQDDINRSTIVSWIDCRL
ncbi:MAG: hypothetical protein GXP54_09190 [Deltaproteobacteria bacterium]|nr:hypothetical protein [Deltaproteobacteria bacterium]